jgi:phosphoribosyl-AMP cyclohydrolase / phosphoribosyl-ATP pyrophosphohydrolase
MTTTTLNNIDFSKGNGLIPAIIQDSRTRRVLMLGYMNAEALAATQTDGRVTFYSRSKGRLWTKGETSEHYLLVKNIQVDCDGDTLLIQAEPQGPVCHTGAATCFGDTPADNLYFLQELAALIHDRWLHPTTRSYTCLLFSKGLNKIAQKVGEEAIELVIEAKDDNPQLFKNEAADLLYHLLVLLEAKNVPLADVVAVLQGRHSGAAC